MDQTEGAHTIISDLTISFREQRRYMGIRTIAPFRGMFAVRDTLLTELRRWVQTPGIADEGPYFLRYHVIDMNHQMDIEVGYVVSQQLPGDDRVIPGSLPAGTYASLTYSRYGMRGNNTLLAWAKTHGLR
jgi:effector-binding domain-containing protein